jgi:molecular chaperone GrpE
VHDIEAQGAAFDPAVHEAILQQPSREHQPGTVTHVALPGYKLHDRVVRPAQVIVAKPPDA